MAKKFKFRSFTQAFKNFAKYIIAYIFRKFKYFEKQIIYLEPPDHGLQNDRFFLCSKSLKFFRTSRNGLNSDYFAKILLFFKIVYFDPKLVNTFYAFRVNIKKLCLECSQKLIDKYSKALVGKCKGSQIIYPQLFVVIGKVDL